MSRFSLSLSSPLIILAVVSFATLGTVSLSQEAKAYSCKSYPTQAVGVRKGKIKARIVARKGWSSIVKSNLGVPWSVWSIAKNKSITCAKINTNQGKKWRCLASAKPCLYVVQ